MYVVLLIVELTTGEGVNGSCELGFVRGAEGASASASESGRKLWRGPTEHTIYGEQAHDAKGCSNHCPKIIGRGNVWRCQDMVMMSMKRSTGVWWNKMICEKRRKERDASHNIYAMTDRFL